jgi:hypothetical protein
MFLFRPVSFVKKNKLVHGCFRIREPESGFISGKKRSTLLYFLLFAPTYLHLLIIRSVSFCLLSVLTREREGTAVVGVEEVSVLVFSSQQCYGPGTIRKRTFLPQRNRNRNKMVSQQFSQTLINTFKETMMLLLTLKKQD